jgi:hypothetical protein
MLSVTWKNVLEHVAAAFNDWGSRGRGFESRRPDSIKALNSGNADQGLKFIDGVLNHPPNTPRKPGPAIRFIIDEHHYAAFRSAGR